MRDRAEVWVGLAFGLLGGWGAAEAQSRVPVTASPAAQASVSHRTRLILKDGSYQVVLSYTVAGKRVRYVSAERAGATEEIPLDLVDLPATERWALEHAPATPDTAGGQARPPVLDPELAKEEADRAALSPEIAKDLRLPPEIEALTLDEFHGTPELVPLTQSEGDLNKQTGHSVVRSVLNPLAAQHQLVTLKGEKASVQVHVSEPAIYLRLDDALPGSGLALTVDTHGAPPARGSKAASPGASRYVMVRTDVRQDARVVSSFSTGAFGGGTTRREDVVETTQEPLPGGHWLKITPREPLLIGEYALVEVLDERSINLSVWDFGVHPTAPENRDAVRPEPRRRGGLEARPR